MNLVRHTIKSSGYHIWGAILVLMMALGMFVSVSATEAADDRPRLVVVLYPQNSDGSPGLFLVDQSIRKVLGEDPTRRVEIYNEYLNIAKRRDAADVQLQHDYLRRKYAGRKVDAVIVGLSSALDYALAHREIFPGSPIVFCSVDERELQRRNLPADVTGVPIHFDLQDTLELALRLHPKTESVAVISGKSEMDVEWEQQARTTFEPFEKRVQFQYLAGLPMVELLEKVAALPEKSVIYYIHVFEDGSGATHVPARALEAIAQRAKVPIYGHVNTYVGRGIVGGRVFDFEAEGTHAARLVQRILAGETVQQIGRQTPLANEYQFDARQLDRWNIARSRLPSGSRIRFNESSFWSEYRFPIIGILVACGVQTILIIALLLQRKRNQRAEERLRANQIQLRQLSGSLIDAQENERRRIARELHDDYNQSLALLSVEIDLLRQKGPDSPAEIVQRLEQLSKRVKELSSSLHELSHELHPLKLEQLGLISAIRSLCQEVSQGHGLTVDFLAEPMPHGIAPETALCLYRIVQESLRNVVKHSGASKASVALNAEEGGVCLRIVDCGSGFDAGTEAGKAGLGLLSMRERLRLIGGRMRIVSKPAQGTQIDVHVPVGSTTAEDGNLKERETLHEFAFSSQLDQPAASAVGG